MTMKISNVKFGSLLSYTPRGDQPKYEMSRTAMRNLKNDRVLSSGILMSSTIAQEIRQKGYPFSDYFGENVILIPTPKSSLSQKNDLWVPQRISVALANNDLGINEECLFRSKAVPKSSTSKASDRPKAKQHYNSLKIKETLLNPKEIVLIDDVITRGATALGAVNKLADAFPNARIRVFAAMRTISNPNEFLDIIQPCTGTIELRKEDTYRSP